MKESTAIQQTFIEEEDKLLKALSKLDGVINGTLEGYSKLKKELAEKEGQDKPLLSNLEIKVLQDDNRRFKKEIEDLKAKIEQEKSKNDKLAKMKQEVADKIEGLIGQLEKVMV